MGGFLRFDCLRNADVVVATVCYRSVVPESIGVSTACAVRLWSNDPVSSTADKLALIMLRNAYLGMSGAKPSRHE